MWRLARQLAVEHRRQVRLHIDQPAVLQRLVPEATTGATRRRRRDPGWIATDDAPPAPPACDSGRGGDRLSCRACRLRSRSAMAPGRPVWINLEYLSAEDWIEGFHRLPSPHPDGLVEHYFYPGFSSGSGGLLREADLFERRDRFQADPRRPRRASWPDSACNAATARRWHRCSAIQTRRSRNWRGSLPVRRKPAPAGARRGRRSAQRCGACSSRRRAPADQPHPVPAAARNTTALLWSCDLNFVRGEDSLVRGVWSGRPFVWQIYRQADDAHLPKLEALPAAAAARARLPMPCAGGTGSPGPHAGCHGAADRRRARGLRCRCLHGLREQPGQRRTSRAGCWPSPTACRSIRNTAGKPAGKL